MFSDKKYLTASQLVPPGEGCSEQCSCSQVVELRCGVGGGAGQRCAVDSPGGAWSEEHVGPS